MKNRSGKWNLLKQLINQDNGDYFDKNGELRRNLGLDYVKTKCFRLIPKRNLNVNDEIGEHNRLLGSYSIDGERYPMEPIQVKVLKQSFQIFCLDK